MFLKRAKNFGVLICKKVKRKSFAIVEVEENKIGVNSSNKRDIKSDRM
jgi:hypothetical protein